MPKSEGHTPLELLTDGRPDYDVGRGRAAFARKWPHSIAQLCQRASQDDFNARYCLRLLTRHLARLEHDDVQDALRLLHHIHFNCSKVVVEEDVPLPLPLLVMDVVYLRTQQLLSPLCDFVEGVDRLDSR